MFTKCEASGWPRRRLIFSLFIASRETGEISIKIQVLKFDCFPGRGSYIFCSVILFRVCLVESIVRRGLCLCLPRPSPISPFRSQTSLTPTAPPSSDLLILVERVVVSGLLRTVGGWETPFLAASFQFGVSGWAPSTIRLAHAKQLKIQSQKEQRVPQFKAPSRKGNNPGVPSRKGRGQEKKKGIKPNFAGNSNKSSNCWKKRKKKKTN